MNFKKFLDKPFRLMAVIGLVYLLAIVLYTVLSGFSYEAVLPYPAEVWYSACAVAFVLFVLSFFFFYNHYFYFAALELLIFSNLYSGRIYIAIFLTAILFILLLLENKLAARVNVAVFLVIEILKLALVIPYGVKSFFEYIGISLFALCTIGCINLMFRHAYAKKDSCEISLEDFKLSDRQKNCIKEIVLNNTTIKALAIEYNVSESAIKKDLSHIYNVLGITGKADLKALFIGYKFD